MRYNNVMSGKFIKRKNRFVAEVSINGINETVHVKNTGRLGELLVENAEVYLEKSDKPERRTKYDLVAVRKSNGLLFNIDSQAANKVTLEWLKQQNLDIVKPEYTYGKSRIDFYFENNGQKYLLEIKGCTLEIDGTGYFPDAPTSRGVKHIRELIKAKKEGFKSVLGFVVQVDGVEKVLPRGETDPEFEKTFLEAKSAGVEVWFLCCHVEEDGLFIKYVIEDNWCPQI